MRQVIFATKNPGKVREIKEILKDLPFEILSLEEAGIQIDVIEDGTTFEENALKKAVEIEKVCGKLVLADDSGLEVDYLHGEPGVYSARFLGEDTPYTVKNKKIIEMLQDAPWEKRTARFVSVIAAAFPGGKTLTARGTIEGFIGYEAKGENGFGYDPIFYVPEHQMTTGQMPMELKNRISHRGKALEQMKRMLKEALEGGLK